MTKAGGNTKANGTPVIGEGDGNIRTRLGVKAFMNAYCERDKNKNRMFQSLLEANCIHNSKDFGAALNGVTAFSIADMFERAFFPATYNQTKVRNEHYA